MVHWRGIWVRKQSGGSRFSACISKRTACENASNLIIMNDTKTVGPTQNSYLDDSRSWSLTMGWRIQQDRNFILPRSYMATTSWPFEGHVYRIPYHANTLEGNVNFRRLKHMRAWPEKVSSIEHCQQNIVLVPLTETNIFETKRGHLFRSWIANYKTKQMKMQGCRFPTEVGQPFWHVHHGWWPSDVRRVETRGALLQLEVGPCRGSSAWKQRKTLRILDCHKWKLLFIPQRSGVSRSKDNINCECDNKSNRYHHSTITCNCFVLLKYSHGASDTYESRCPGTFQVYRITTYLDISIKGS